MGARLSAIERVYRARQPGFAAALTSVAGSPEAALEAVQEGFAIAVRERRTFRGGSLEAWIWKIAWRTALRSSPPETTFDFDAVDVSIPDDHADSELAAAIRTLSPRRRLIVFLRYFADMPYTEIAAALDVSEGTVAATLSQSHEALRRQLQTEEVRP